MISIQTALLRLSLALVLGAIVGLERERGERSAGLRTNILVALGSCLFIIVSAFGFSDILGTHNVQLDPSRIAAQVVSGIGFLGAGIIFFHKEIIKGLTTAAAIWVVAAIGLACGAGLLVEAAITTGLTLTVLLLLKPLKRGINHSSVIYQLQIRVIAKEEALLDRVYEMCVQAGVTIETIEVQAENGKERVAIECSTSDAPPLTQSLMALHSVSGIESIFVNLRNSNSVITPFPIFNERHELKKANK